MGLLSAQAASMLSSTTSLRKRNEQTASFKTPSTSEDVKARSTDTDRPAEQSRHHDGSTARSIRFDQGMMWAEGRRSPSTPLGTVQRQAMQSIQSASTLCTGPTQTSQAQAQGGQGQTWKSLRHRHHRCGALLTSRNEAAVRHCDSAATDASNRRRFSDRTVRATGGGATASSTSANGIQGLQ